MFGLPIGLLSGSVSGSVRIGSFRIGSFRIGSLRIDSLRIGSLRERKSHAEPLLAGWQTALIQSITFPRIGKARAPASSLFRTTPMFSNV